MKRSIPILLVLVLALSAGTMLLQDNSSIYSPREGTMAQGASGAADIRHDMLADPSTGEINYEYISRVESALARMEPASSNRNVDLEWISAGPNNVGGRTRAIMSYEEDPTRVFIGSVTGGLYQSFNSGEEWSLVESFNVNTAVSAIARTGNGNIFVGTGHFAESFRGNGLYVSEDDGVTWNILQNFTPDATFATNSEWSRINVLAADPVDDDRLWIAHLGGLSTYDWDDDSNVERLPSTTTSLSISDDGQVIVATASDKVYVSTNGGSSFDLRSGSAFGTVPSSGIGRIEVALSKDDPNYMYALAASPNGYMKGIYATTNMGATWYEIFGSSLNGDLPFSPFSVSIYGQGNYDNAITVIPGIPTQCIIGGIRLYNIEITGENPPMAQQNSINVNFSNGPNPFYVHSDIHTFDWDANGVLYIGCDGGIFKSFNNGITFVSSNYNYRSTQFYGMDYNSNGAVIAGAQDNGTHLITGFNISNNDSQEVQGGDGFDCNISKFEPLIAFGTSQFNSVARTFDGGISGAQIITSETDMDDPSFFPGPFWTIIDLDETLDAPNTIAQDFPWSNQFLEQDQFVSYNGTEYVDGDTIVFTNELCLSGVQYSNEDTLIVESQNYPYYLAPGAMHPYASESFSIPYTYTNNTGGKLYSFCDVVPAPDPAQSLFCVGGSSAFRMTRDATKNTVAGGDIQWAEISDGISGTITCFEFSPDHDKLYIGTNSQVYRISGLNNAYTKEALEEAAVNTLISIFSGGVRDLAVDMNNNDRLLISKAGYSTADKLFLSEEAATTTGNSSFEAIWNFPSDLALMPAYSCQFDMNTPDRILVGTEYGVWVTEDLGATWEECNTNMGRVPVYAIEQQVLSTEDMILGRVVLNEGAIYAGTFGKGVHYVGDYVLGIDDLNNGDAQLVTNLSIYPNPVADIATLNLQMIENVEVSIQVFDMNGRLVQDLPQGKLSVGEHNIELNVGNSAEGTYLVRIQAGIQSQTIRFIVSR